MDAQNRQFHELMQRPDIDQATARYEELYAMVRTQLTAAFPNLKWEILEGPDKSGCGPEFREVNADLPKNDSISNALDSWVAQGGLTDAQWEQALAVVRPLVQSYGFDPGFRIADRPGEGHDIVFYDQYEAHLDFGAGNNTTLLFMTGCHLTPEAKRRGTPAARPVY